MKEGTTMQKQKSSCDYCVNYGYNEEYECWECAVNLDEDELYRVRNDRYSGCPYYRPGDEYKIVQKQN